MHFDGPEPTNYDFTVLTEILEEYQANVESTYNILVELLQDLPPEKKILFQSVHAYVKAAKVALENASRDMYDINFNLHGDKDYRWEADRDS